MTNRLRRLLQQYGALTVTVSELARQRPGTQRESLDALYESFGAPDPDEPVLHVRISKDGELRLLEEAEHDLQCIDEQGRKTGVVTVWEMPEDEFWYFKAFRPAAFDLDKELPAFFYGMAITYAYAMFETFVGDVIRQQLVKYPKLMSSERQVKYGDVFEIESKEALIRSMAAREVNELMYQPLIAVLKKMRDRYGFSAVTEEYDASAYRISLIRNCILHNGSTVDSKLATYDNNVAVGNSLCLADSDLSVAVNVLRKLAYKLDCAVKDLTSDENVDDAFRSGDVTARRYLVKRSI